MSHQYKYTSLTDMDGDAVQRFLETQQFEKPLTFAKTESAFTKYAGCGAWALALASYGITCFMPVSLFCPRRITQHYSLQLDQELLTFNSAVNDCCLHVARSTKNVPLDKVQDVQLQEGCCETMFGLKTLQVQTAGPNGPSGAPEVMARFLRDPEQAREAIQLAVKLSRARAMTAPAPMAQMMHHGSCASGSAGIGTAAPAAGATEREGSMRERLERLQQLVELGVLSDEEVGRVRAKVLTAPQDFTRSLFEAHELLKEGLISERDLKAIKTELLNQARC